MPLIARNLTKFSVSLLSLVVLNLGCADTKKDEINSNHVSTGSLKDSLEMITHAEAVVDDSSASPSVGWLLSASEKYVDECTTFVVGPRMLYTNSHCILDSLKSPGLSAQGLMTVIFPETGGYPGSRMKIKEIVFTSNITEDKNAADYLLRPDYAVITTEEDIQRPSIYLDKAGIEDGRVYDIHSMNPSRNGNFLTGHLVRRTCEALHMSKEVLGTNNLNAPIMTFKDCNIISGNSGSPVMNGAFSAVGTAYGTATLAKEIDLNAERGKVTANHDVTFVTSFSCATDFAIPNSGRILPAACSIQQWSPVTNPMESPSSSLANTVKLLR